jgi:hypothetical protein
MHNSNSEHNSAPIAPIARTDTTANDVTAENETFKPVTPEVLPVKDTTDAHDDASLSKTGGDTTKSDGSKSFTWWGRSNKVCAQRF